MMAYAIKLDVPEHISMKSKIHNDRIEFIGYNSLTKKEITKPFYFKEGESQAMINLKQVSIIESLIQELH